ncbi:MAG: VTT domain-containing protein [Propionibacteriaceae bacterium]|jgi:membrane protein DedA with SNARE-associated domain|nr:VTT domain-containing protein [Propionibacteriaceae bacterium]
MSQNDLYQGDGPFLLEIPPDDAPKSTRLGADSDGVVAGGDSEGAEVEREWWDDPAMPWTGKPVRADYACICWILGAFAVSMAMMSFQPVILAAAPQFLGSLGYRTGLIMTGAQAAVGDLWWPLVLFLGSILAMKFDWIYWWAGHRWGRTYINTLLGKTERARKRNARFERIARKYEVAAIALTYLPIPLPVGLIYVVLGEAGTSIKKFLGVDIICSFIMASIYMAIGFAIGKPAVDFMEQYAKYMWYVSIAIIVGIVFFAFWNVRKEPFADETAPESTQAPELADAVTPGEDK